MMFWDGSHMSGWGYGLMTVSMVLLWGLVILAIIATARYLGRSDGRADAIPPPPARPTPEQLLAERYARGEIDADEYRERLDTLRGDLLRHGARPVTKS